MNTVIVESPYAGDIEKNVEYARAAIRDCLMRGEAPFASHLLYTQDGVLKDEIPEEREHGIQAGFIWKQMASKTVVYVDCGISKGMLYGVDVSLEMGQPIDIRSLEAWANEETEANTEQVEGAIKTFFKDEKLEEQLRAQFRELRKSRTLDFTCSISLFGVPNMGKLDLTAKAEWDSGSACQVWASPRNLDEATTESKIVAEKFNSQKANWPEEVIDFVGEYNRGLAVFTRKVRQFEEFNGYNPMA